MTEEERDDLEDKERAERIEILNRKKSTNMLLLGCISITMVFAGLTSAYIVSKSDNFWVEMKLPSWFITSTVVILLCSLLLYLALRAAKKDKQSLVKGLIIGSVLGGIGFTYTQFMGWSEMVDNGYYFVGKITTDGRYGQNIDVTIDGVPVEYKEPNFLLNDEPLSENQLTGLKEFFQAIHNSDHKQMRYDLDEFPNYAIRVYNDSSQILESFTYEDHKLYRLSPGFEEKNFLGREQGIYLKRFARNMVEDRGYFYMKGVYGEDFTIVYKGVPIEMKNGVFYANDTRLSEQEMAEFEGTQNVASSFIYILSGLHLLHLFGGWLYLISISRRALKENFGSHNYLKIKLGGMYWHFLGGLWIFLYLFLTIIH